MELRMGKSLVFTNINMLVSRILKCLVNSYCQNTRQLLLAEIVTLAASSLAGILATRLVCEKTIKWKQAFASSLISHTAVIYTWFLLMKPMPLKCCLLEK